jgi:separase
MLQSLRLWNRAVDTLGRLNPLPQSSAKPSSESNPFEMTSLKEALRAEQTSAPAQPQPTPNKTYPSRSFIHDLEWRTAEGLFSTLFALSQMYLTRGSPREAEYFAQQAQDLAEALNVPTVVGRALARKGEVQLHLGQLQEANSTLEEAAALLSHLPGIDTIVVHRLRAECNERSAQHEDAQELYLSTVKILEELDGAFQQFETLAFGYVALYLFLPNKTKKLLSLQSSTITRSIPSDQASP